ncbi:very-long-chain 3-oxoacyl-CoA reductase 1-like [Macadamia integrifolia]|uniref:very-long-chain 3-oxoacyl-CoA reductase 1-like n=1 Tax=Macadamia integrifolia TaxID=60698 RepID=UPI001C4EDB6D|nr:very-long-chain 3-oxoacyl-CoA reductase 1-like [Macadamia integrifolia]
MELCIGEQIKAQPFWVLVALILGFLLVLNSALASLRWVYVYFVRPAKDLKKYGSWALVTGPTDGIGKSLAFELAGKYLNLVLVGRNLEKLNDVSDAIKARYGGTQIRNVVVDLAGDLSEGIERIGEAIEGLDVGVLVNCAGVSYPYARFFHEVDEEMLKDVIQVNVEAINRVTNAVLPGMLGRKRGAIVNIGSGSVTATPSFPLVSVYAATKAYVHELSRNLHVECKLNGIDVQCQVPLHVATKMSRIEKSSLFTPSPEEYSKASIRWIGYDHTCVPYWPHSIQTTLLRALPQDLVDWFLFRYFLDIRNEGQIQDFLKNSKNKGYIRG